MAAEVKNLDIKDLLPFHHAYKYVLPRIDSDLDRIDELVTLLRTNKYRTLMANPKPTTFEPHKKRNREDKERLYAGNHEFKDNIVNKLTSAELEEIAGAQNSHHAATLENYIPSESNGMSGELDLNEIECLRYWIAAKIELEVEGKIYNTFYNTKDICIKAKELYRFEQIYELSILLTLLKKRNDYYNDFKTNENQFDLEYRIQERIIKQTNVLINQGIFTQIIENIKIGASYIPKYFKVHDDEQLQKMIEAKYDHCLILLKTLVRCIFRITTNTQLIYEEAKQLRDTIRDFSASIVDNNKGFNFDDDQIESSMIKPYGFFVMLQLSLVNAWNQDENFFLRNQNFYPFKSEDEEEFENELNRQIKKISKHNDEHNEHGKENLHQNWTCNGVRGFLSLIFATVHSTKCELDDRSEVTDMFWFFNVARKTRAYTYIRLCILPVLQTNYDFDEDEIDLCYNALQYLLSKILEIGVIWKKQYPEPEYDTHFLRYNLREREIQNDPEHERGPNYDYIDDVLQTFASFTSVFPAFVNSFWNFDMLQDDNSNVELHTFLMMNVENCYFDDDLDKRLSVLQLLISVASGRDDRASLAMYKFLDKYSNPHERNRFDQNLRETSILDDLFNRLSDTAINFGMVEVLKNSAKVAVPLEWSNDQDALSKTMPLSSIELLVLIATADLLTAIFQNQKVFEKLMESGRYQDPINVIFSLILCPVKIDLKGALFRCLSVIAFHSAEHAKRIWELLENNQVLPSVLRDEGVRFELKSELNAGRYPCTEGFLDLLSSLLSHEVPDDLGQGYRWPGIMPYLEFVVDDIILNSRRGRHYEPDSPLGSAQRWRLTSRALKVLAVVLQHYDINSLRFEDQSNSKSELDIDFKDDTDEYEIRRENGNIEKITCPKPKSAGFVIMSLLLGNFRLMEAIIALLTEGNFNRIEESRSNMIQHMNELALNRFHDLKTSFNQKFRLHKSKENVLSRNNLLEYGCCDEAYWMEKTTTMCIGILYECSLREDVFLQNFRTRSGLKIKRTEGGRPCFVPIIIHGGLSSILSTYLDTLCGLLQLQSKNIYCIPKMPVMAARILEHVSLSLSSEDFLSGAQRTSINKLRSGLSELLASRYEDDNISKYGLPLGGEFAIDMFTMSKGASRPLRLKLFVSSCDDDLQTLQTLNAQPIKDAIISLLLSTLSRDRSECLSHYLLGVSKDFDDTDKEMNCLNSILSILNTPDWREHMLIFYPARACLCFELLHNLCTSIKRISEKALFKIRDSKEPFKLLKQLMYCCEIMRQKDNISNEIKSAAYNCCAWILQICALEFRTLSQQSKNAQHVKELLTGLLQSQSQVKLSDPIILIDVLKFAFEEAPIIHIYDKKYPLMWNALRNSQTQWEGEEECVKIDQDTLNYLLRKPVHDILKEGCPRDEVSAEFDNIKRLAEEVNESNNFLSASFHLCRAWNQVVSIALNSCLKNCFSVLVRGPINIPDKIKTDMTQLTDTLIIPTLKVLGSSQSLVSSERIIPSVLVMMNAINESKKQLNDDEDLPISTEQLHQIVNSLISLILHQTTGREDSSRYKGFLYVSMIEILNIVPKSIDPSASFQVYNYISQNARQLMEPLIFDSLKSPTIWRLSALSLMSMIVNICSDCSNPIVNNNALMLVDDISYQQNSSVFDVHTIVVNDLLKSGNLSNILDGMGPIHNPSIDGIYDFYDNIDEDILQNTLAFCVQVASTVNGVNALITCGIMSRINNYPHLNDSLGILNPAVENNSDVIKVLENFLETKFMPVLSILKAMIITSSSSQVIHGAAKYILHNHLVFSYLLRLKLKTLRGLEMTEAAVSLLNLVVGGIETSAGYLGYLQKDNKNVIPDSSTLLTWDLVLGNRSDTIVTCVCELLKKIGARDPYPLKMTRRNTQDPSSAWWSQIQPSNEQEENESKETFKRRKTDINDDINDISNNLNVFDFKKRTLGLDILHSATTFLRIRTSSIHKETNDGGNNLATVTSADYLSIDYDIISEVFCKCSSICRERRNNINNDDDGSTKILEIICENLIFVIYHLVQSTSSRSRELTQLSNTENCIRHGEDWPPQSLVNQVSRWIKDVIYNSNNHIGRY